MNRGGSFNNPAVNARSANRNNNAPTIRNNNLGLRPAKTSHCQIEMVASRHRRVVHRDVQIRCRCRRTVRWPNSQRASGVVGREDRASRRSRLIWAIRSCTPDSLRSW